LNRDPGRFQELGIEGLLGIGFTLERFNHLLDARETFFVVIAFDHDRGYAVERKLGCTQLHTSSGRVVPKSLESSCYREVSDSGEAGVGRSKHGDSQHTETSGWRWRSHRDVR